MPDLITPDYHLPEGFYLQETSDTLTGKLMQTYRHQSGFVLKVLPRPGFSSRFAALTVPYGSIHTQFCVDGQLHTVPAGTAHFLEHCVFSRDEHGGLLGSFSELGAMANAYTTYTHTLYYFSTVHHFDQALQLYLDAVLNPYLEPDRVESECPVILAELDLNQDDPDTRCAMQMLDNLYASHPVRQDIGGTAASVQTITSEQLKLVWRSFYQPGCLSLTIVGDFDARPLLQNLAGRLALVKPVQAEPFFAAEPTRPVRTASQLDLPVAAPSFLVGIKDPTILPESPLTGRELVKRQRAARLVLNTLLSHASPLYEDLFARGLISDSFGFHYACEQNFSFLAIGGESPDPKAAAVALTEGLIRHFTAGIDPHLFEIQKRAAAGDFVRSLDSIEHSGMVQAQCNLHDIDLFEYPALYDNMDLATAVSMLSFLADPSCYTQSIIAISGGT
jgi:predicted Zn-dependent peptidase